MKCSATECACISTFLEKAFVSLVNRRIDIRIVRFWRSTYDVLTCFGFGLPVTVFTSQPKHLAGEYRLSVSGSEP